jgi:hypothetical protein
VEADGVSTPPARASGLLVAWCVLGIVAVLAWALIFGGLR